MSSFVSELYICVKDLHGSLKIRLQPRHLQKEIAQRGIIQICYQEYHSKSQDLENLLIPPPKPASWLPTWSDQVRSYYGINKGSCGQVHRDLKLTSEYFSRQVL